VKDFELKITKEQENKLKFKWETTLANKRELESK